MLDTPWRLDFIHIILKHDQSIKTTPQNKLLLDMAINYEPDKHSKVFDERFEFALDYFQLDLRLTLKIN